VINSEEDAMATIVVGVDGSKHSKAALRWAIDYASRLPGARVIAVMTWSYPIVPAVPLGATYVPMEDLTDITIARLREVVDEVAGDSPVEVEEVVRCGAAAQTLLAEAEHADLLVVGTRGLGGFTGLLLGSVSHQIASHAPCPVAIIPAAEED
jgi:nucleotide-binding universal stress UspA family protein